MPRLFKYTSRRGSHVTLATPKTEKLKEKIIIQMKYIWFYILYILIVKSFIPAMI